MKYNFFNSVNLFFPKLARNFNITVFLLMLSYFQVGISNSHTENLPQRTVFEWHHPPDCYDHDFKYLLVVKWELNNYPEIICKDTVNLASGKVKTVFNIQESGLYELDISKSPHVMDGVYNLRIENSVHLVLFLEPGDSIVYKTCPDKGDFIYGKGVSNNAFAVRNFNYYVDWMNDRALTEDRVLYWLNKSKDTYKEHKNELDKIRFKLSPGFYKFLLNQVEYGYHENRISLLISFYCFINDYLKGNDLKKKNKKIQKLVMPELTLNELFDDSFINYPGYKNFIQGYAMYLAFINQKLLVIGHELQVDKEVFDYANKILSGAAKEYFLAQVLKDFLDYPDKKEIVRPYYTDYIKDYPNSKYTRILTTIFNARGDISLGKPTPEFSLKDQNGHLVSLSSFKGKNVYLYFYTDEYWLKQINKGLLNYPDLIKIFVYTGNDTVYFQKNALLYPNAVHLFNKNWKYAKEYNGYHYNYLIDKRGKFLQIFRAAKSEELEYNLFKTFNGQKSLKNNSNVLLLIVLIVGITIFAVGIAWVTIRWRSKIISKREEKRHKLVEMELRGIRAQMNPHFMFNSLNSIQNLINQSKVQEANLYLSKYAELMRMILHNSDKPVIPLADEIEAIRTYCELEQLRFNFDFTIDIDKNTDVYNIEIPGMLIQPYVENAIIHGIINLYNGKGDLRIAVSLTNQTLLCTVDDNGIGRKASETLKMNKKIQNNGFGLRLSQERIDLLNSQHKKNIKVNITDKQNSTGEAAGTKVEIIFPLMD